MLGTYLRKNYGTITANQKIRETTAVYFASLEGILRAEEKRLKTSNLDALAHNGTFHCALLAISCETASVAYGRREFAPFPKILDDFDIEPFDLTKVIGRERVKSLRIVKFAGILVLAFLFLAGSCPRVWASCLTACSSS
mmetsp:Transcript_43386/g.169800  ORF Transcript_43386/g.169800 Transcript_43386/m.169800 type:complete len:140 (+) Transcript_43386:1515-1934(+)